MLTVTPNITIPDQELEENFVKSSGPGGQNVNKVATSVQLRFDAKNSPSIPPYVFARLRNVASHLMTKEGVIVIISDTHRLQSRNREDARARLAALIAKASERPKKRIPTKPTRASKVRRVDAKKQRGALKKGRKSVSKSDY
ncbi:alternative ribosome rescue aminoacyl-tRNA hydrolase ArfB [Sneathiella limimaris]|uniref:alternative ribosome rescue aminoacyl-tRNA hydrolase ArfB n=1 Tax=Sneathiella limimaris TaxID=1964213 RepID=UPI00146B2FAA|nr:alternative ribosome rescue aminoacyl-tRNA hydrolase ArfB [Sneathiella limimaris]